MNTNGSRLNQNIRNPKFVKDTNAPDTDSRVEELNIYGLRVTPNLRHDHTRLTYSCPIGNTSNVTFTNYINGEERSMHTITLNNSQNNFNKIFIFSPQYVFQDGGTNTITVDAGKVAIYYGTVIANKMYLRISLESTN